ncbi:MAG: hypothetical protein EHM53_12950 [Methanoregulaceae archaeon]|nr:MAG: hypothetical protein EHM53_12950 [Methanoregulaceae archaeon]
MKSWTLSLLLLSGSIALSALFWIAGLPFFFLFLVIPFLPLVFRSGRTKRCPVCGWETTGNERFCPYDANILEDDGPHGG